MAGENKWAVMGGITLNVEYTRKYGFDATAAAKVTAKLVAVPPPRLFQEAVQADAIGRTKLRSSLALLKEPELPWFLGEDGDYSGENQAVADELDALEAD